ncbi:hypothetical protein GCM10009678_67360 [Actinomadura kijaniata]|uniref:Anti-sigma regulatory factor (Ser/Thr protein kinase) n=1 Tax=Actinomadura namibiensis TaxID=182080 RepID=A0A7W3QQ45_ACTNM|nr:ATP-binding protein [Actinomadura namibiensis]MBA8954823.1 anti-sigma regulatory factor (Ser/Thr protein kinase) [Actinomadura namibiensis]
MIVDLADAATHARGPRRTAPEHPHRQPDPGPAPARPDARRDPGAGAPTVASGLRGFWPVPHTGTPRTARRVLRADPTCAREARGFTTATLADWGLTTGERADDVVLAVSELVSNALRHGMRDLSPGSAHPVQLVLLGHPRRLVAVVTDPGEDTPEPTAHGAEWFGEDGRGLLVVAGVSDAWGWAPLSTGGKAVWASFDLPRPHTETAA